MSEVSFTRDIECRSDRIREQLLDHEFLTQFVKRQDPVEYEISVNADAPTSTISWSKSTDKMPGIARRLVGGTIPIRVVFIVPGLTAGQDGSVNLNLEGKVKGELQASLSVQDIDHHLPQTTMAIHGPFRISAGLLSGKASDMARNHLIMPLLEELADLLQEGSVGSSI
jgi:hypothetical protein